MMKIAQILEVLRRAYPKQDACALGSCKQRKFALDSIRLDVMLAALKLGVTETILGRPIIISWPTLGRSRFTRLMVWLANPDVETTDWRAVSRENRTHGSEGGDGERCSLPLF